MAVEIGDYGSHPARWWKRFVFRSTWLHYALLTLTFYALWILLVHFFSLTLVTYFVSSPQANLQEIHDLFYSNQLSILGCASFCFIWLIRLLEPLTTTRSEEIFQKGRFERLFVPGFTRGAALAGSLCLFFIFIGTYKYLGYLIEFSAAPLDAPNITFRILCLGVLAYCEEFIFRGAIRKYLAGKVPVFLAAQLSALAYCGVKTLQFNLGLMHLLSLYLLSLALYYRTDREAHFERGAGYWAALLIIFQPILSLPLFGSEYTGFLIIKIDSSQLSLTQKLLTGGAGGPLSSLILQLLLLLDVLRSMLILSSLGTSTTTRNPVRPPEKSALGER